MFLLLWTRRLQAAAALTLAVSAFLPWLRFPLFGLTLYVPGLFMHGAWVLGAALGTLLLVMGGLRQPLAPLSLALGALYALVAQWRAIEHGTDYALGRLQLSLAGINDALARVNAGRIEVVPTGWPPSQYVAFGWWVAVGAALVLLLAVVAEMAVAASYRAPLSVVWGQPRCRQCGGRSPWEAVFCPQCGRSQGVGQPCGACGGWLEPGANFCMRCGVAATSPPSERIPT